MADELPSAELWQQRMPQWDALESAFAPACQRFLPASASARPVWIACSGGCDSVALLCLLLRLTPRGGHRQLRVVHIHHGLRGAAADADADWVCRLATEWGLACEVLRLEPLPNPDEAALRAARFAAIEGCLRKSGAQAVFLGHQLDDVAEGMLLGLGRGAGLGGLASPRPVQAVRMAGGATAYRLHPLLSCPREALREALVASGIHWREDASNAGDSYARNRLRKRVIPELEAALPQTAVANFERSRQLLEEADAVLDAWLGELMGEGLNAPELDASALRGKPRGLWRRAFFRWLNARTAAPAIRRQALEPLLDAWIEGASLSQDHGQVRLQVEDFCLRLEVPAGGSTASWAAVGWAPGSRLFLPGGAVLSAYRIDGEAARDRLHEAAVDCRFEALVDLPAERFEVGLWQAGDRMRPLGAPGSRKLQDIFTDRGIDVERRKRLPVLRHRGDGGIVWVPGIPSADGLRIRRSTKSALQLTYTEHCTA